MAIFPTTAIPVRIIGGLRGSDVGPTGALGPMASILMGATGLIGPTGLRGLTGSPGADGLDSLLTGMTGKPGPTGAEGYPGPIGPTGPFEFIPEDRFRYYENLLGYTLTTSGAAVGCKFYYQAKRQGCILLVIFTGIAEPIDTDVFKLGIGHGVGPAPNPGEWAWYGDVIQVVGAGLSIPFMTTYLFDYHNQYPDPDFPYDEKWFDLTTYGGGGTIRNIACIVLEL